MKGDPKILQHLNAVLKNELTAINQYFLHSRMFGHWGLERLEEHEKDESIDEMKHADRLIERVLFLDGLPNLQKLNKLSIGTTVPEILRNDLGAEMIAVPLLNRCVQQCRDLGDNGSETLFKDILVSEEEHVDWLEAQLELIKQVGDAQYLAQQIKKEG